MTHAIKDFGDWLSPIIVKELRQGMRTRLFTVSFIVLQAMMVLCMLGGFSEDSNQSASTGFFWAFIAFALVFVMPLRGFGSLSGEIRLDTMDLMSLTRLSAFRIVFGKWAALMSQTVLLVTAVLPYVVLRYFFGGVNVVAELVFLGMGLVASGLISALMVCFSSFRNFLVRIILALGLCVLAIIMTSSFMSVGIYSPSGIPWGEMAGAVWIYAIVVLMASFLIWYVLDMSATRIAPEAVNYSTRRRLAAIAVTAILPNLPHVSSSLPPEPFWFVTVCLMILFGFDALTESPSTVRSLHLKFERLGPLGRILSAFLAPGWASGLLFVLLLGAICFVSAFGTQVIAEPTRSLAVHISIVNGLVFPLLIIQLFYPATQHLLPAWFFVQAAVCATSVFLIAVAESVTSSMVLLAAPLPPVSLYLAAEDGGRDFDAVLLPVAGVVLAVSLLIGYWRATPVRRQVAIYRQELRQQKSAPSLSTGNLETPAA